MNFARNSGIAARFGRRVATYERHAHLQRQVAARLARMLPKLKRPRVLELGCGTGLFSRHLVRNYPDGRFLFTDLSADALDVCVQNIGAVDADWRQVDAELPRIDGPFDIIASSMTLQWLADPSAAIARWRRLLASGGVLLHATPLAGSFPEWRESLALSGCENGLITLPSLCDLTSEGVHVAEGGALAFLRSLAALGASTPRAGYRPQPSGALRRAMRILDARFEGRVTWRIGYAAETCGTCRSTPSISAA